MKLQLVEMQPHLEISRLAILVLEWNRIAKAKPCGQEEIPQEQSHSSKSYCQMGIVTYSSHLQRATSNFAALIVYQSSRCSLDTTNNAYGKDYPEMYLHQPISAVVLKALVMVGIAVLRILPSCGIVRTKSMHNLRQDKTYYTS